MPRLTKWKKGTSLATKKLTARVARLNTSLKKVREEANTDKIKGTGLAVGGGALAGALNVYTEPIADVVPIASLVGIALVLFGSTGRKPMHNALAMIGAGALAKGAGDFAEDGIAGMRKPELAEAAS